MSPPKLPKQTGKAKAKAAEVIERAQDILNDRLEEIAQGVVDRAVGLYVEETVPGTQGTIRRYRREPDLEAAKLALAYQMGKPVTRVETGAIGETSEFEEWIKERQALETGKDAALALPAPPEGNKAHSVAAREDLGDVLAEIGWKDG